MDKLEDTTITNTFHVQLRKRSPDDTVKMQKMSDLWTTFQSEFDEQKRIQNMCLSASYRTDFLENLEEYQNFSISGQNCIVRSFQSCPEDYIDWIVALTAENTVEFYRNAWGWSKRSKFFEISEESACFLIAVIDDTPIGFVHFRFEVQDRMFTLFVYDIEVDKDFQGNGLGTFLLNAIESIGREMKADCLMTMLFKANTPGIDFFMKNGFISSRISPENLNTEKSNAFKHVLLYKALANKNA